MILKCPNCKTSDHLQIERRLDGNIVCMNCNTKGKHSEFNFRTQHLEEIFDIITQLAQRDLRLGQIFKIIDLKFNDKDIFYIENDKFLEELKKYIE